MLKPIDINFAFKTLDLEPGVSQGEIKQAYRKLVKQWHPDCFLEPSKKLDAEEKIKIINQAYELLKNYDAGARKSSVDTYSSSNKQNIYSQASNPETFYKRGLEKGQRGKYTEAIEDFTSAIRLNPNYFEAYKFRALACEKLGYVNRAKSDYRKASELEVIQKRIEFNQKQQNRQQETQQSPKNTYDYYDLEGFKKPSTDSSKKTKIASPWKIVKTIDNGSKISRLAISHKDNFIASGNMGNTVKVWNFKTGELLKTFTHNQQIVRCIAFSQDSQMLASGSDDGSIFIWEVATGKLINHIQVHSASVCSVIITPDNQNIISSSVDTTIKFSHITMGQMLYVIKAHGDTVYGLNLSSNNQILASCSSDKTVKLWHLKTRKLAHVLAKHSGWVITIAMSPDGQTIASGGSDKSIVLWDVNTGKAIKSLSGHSTHILSLTFSPDSQFLASASVDGTLKLWKANNGEELYTVCNYSTSINTVRFSPDSKSIISASNDGSIQIWQC
ncbi:MAG: DnaJ domain-containing protein [Nostocaceae cyanobacterium]|nr:DnaJ domain-containing protein [Nostocaceae cyanobacterium]